MNPQDQLVETIASLAKEVNGSDIDWGMLSVDEDSLYRMLANSTIDNKGLDDPFIARVVVTSLLVESFILNSKLLQSIK